MTNMTKPEHPVNNDDTLVAMGGRRAMTTVPAIMKYVAGCIVRERERIARHLRSLNVSEEVIIAILDESEDEQVFKWRPPASARPTEKGDDRD